MTSTKISHQERNAARQRDEIRAKVARTVWGVRREIERSRDPITGRSRYVADKGNGVRECRFSRAEFLRRADIDKNTLKKPYHASSLRAVDRLVRWVKERCDKRAPQVSALTRTKGIANPPNSLSARLRIELDELAEKFGTLEFELIELGRTVRALRANLDCKNRENNELISQNIQLKELIVSLRPISTSDKVNAANIRLDND
ncbi:hypothetical protein [Sphingobium yanoikuyae]|uniref:Uncharacterized protein n=1 Tax=Sphingobium yanoikuyae TaxID=13690 RepID=A0A9X7YE14_SPHYA|nr:hypothetical protein [Sphingobium yanoikuyae]QNG47080.1 hypothetical protein H3V42_05470 [Sphingobium yanoikuyae]